ncbi:diacylglycerol/lipid kinase family protein [Trujillonella humicola]|uniref:diacylglycerol/lipid kinase family protein n=1 Tax=Trujillonella humicola TaxID=3383699 RepID=UPI003906B2CF
MTGLLVTVNASAGTADDDAVAAALAELRAGADVEVVETSDADELVTGIRAHPGRRLVAIGGDGSVHAAVRALDRAGALDPALPLGIIARGTGNDLAGSLGLPRDPVEGARVVCRGRVRPLDLVRDDAGGIVVNAVHAGVGARAGTLAMHVKPALGTASFPLGAVAAGVSTPGAGLRVEVDGRVVTSGEWAADGTTGVLMVAVCNGPTIAGGRPLAPDAAPDDGLADVVVVTATGPVARTAFGLALLRGDHLARADVTVTRGRTVSYSGPPVDVDADGEITEDVPARTWTVHGHAWSVTVRD